MIIIRIKIKIDRMEKGRIFNPEWKIPINVFEDPLHPSLPYELSLIISLARPSFDYKSLSESSKFLAENF